MIIIIIINNNNNNLQPIVHWKAMDRNSQMLIFFYEGLKIVMTISMISEQH